MTRETAIGLLLRSMDDESHVRASHWGANHEYILWAHVVDEPSESERFLAFDTARLRELANVLDLLWGIGFATHKGAARGLNDEGGKILWRRLDEVAFNLYHGSQLPEVGEIDR